MVFPNKSCERASAKRSVRALVNVWTLRVHGCIGAKNEYSTVNTGSGLQRVRERVCAEIEKGEQGGSPGLARGDLP